MDSIIRVGLGSIIFFWCLFYVTDISQIRIMDDDNRDSLDVASRTAISQSVNRGTLRVEERITIDPDVAEEALVRSYANNISFDGKMGDRGLYIKKIQADPALIAVEARSETESYYKHYLNNRNKDNFPNDTKIDVGEKNIVIYEAKSIETPPKGGVVEE
ncbi:MULTISPECIES: hypothetical protein [Pseudobacillus]|uniref:hypothetical protein n=1 Tax=Pseudobacillus TaxID=108525 RepID=UPI0038793E05